MKKDLIRKFVEKLDYSYRYKTVNERQNIINDLCEIAGIEQLTISRVVGKSEQFYCELSNKTECHCTGVQCPECKEFEDKWKQ